MNAGSNKVKALRSALIIENFKLTGEFKECDMGPCERLSRDMVLVDDTHAEYQLTEILVIVKRKD
jgi:hypothetical protein